MKKIIKKYGNSNVVVLSSEDMKIYELKEGDVVELHLRKPREERVEYVEDTE